MKQLRTALILALLAQFCLTPSIALACGGKRYSQVPLSFETFKPSLNQLGLTLVPSSDYGWIIRDKDGAELYFGLSRSGGTELCMRITPDDNPICGDDLKALGRDKTITLRNSAGQRVAALEFTNSPAFIITPLKSDGSKSDDYIRIANRLENLDNTNYNTTLQLETYENFKVASSMHASLPLTVRDGRLRGGTPIGRCINLEAKPLDIAGNQSINADGEGLISHIGVGRASPNNLVVESTKGTQSVK